MSALPRTPHDPLPEPEDAAPIDRYEHVRVPDGRIGQVIGFYRTEDEALLVRIGTGESRRYRRADLRLLG